MVQSHSGNGRDNPDNTDSPDSLGDVKKEYHDNGDGKRLHVIYTLSPNQLVRLSGLLGSPGLFICGSNHAVAYHDNTDNPDNSGGIGVCHAPGVSLARPSAPPK